MPAPDPTIVEKVAKSIAEGEGWDGRVSEDALDTKPGPMKPARWEDYLEQARRHIGENSIMQRAPQ